MNNLSRIHDFFFGNPQKMGIDTIPPEELLKLMKKTDKKQKSIPYAKDIGSLLFNENNKCN